MQATQVMVSQHFTVEAWSGLPGHSDVHLVLHVADGHARVFEAGPQGRLLAEVRVPGPIQALPAKALELAPPATPEGPEAGETLSGGRTRLRPLLPLVWVPADGRLLGYPSPAIADRVARECSGVVAFLPVSRDYRPAALPRRTHAIQPVVPASWPAEVCR